MMEHPFVLFGPAHLCALALALIVPLALAAIVRLTASERLAGAVRWLFVAFLISAYILWYATLYEKGWHNAANVLPMHLCDWAAIAAMITLIRPNQRTYEVAYFWALIATLQASLTPELAFDFPDLRFIVFFAIHCGVIASVLYLTFGMRLRPVAASIPRVIGATLVYGVVAGAVDWVSGANYGFLRAKSKDPSVLDLLAPWPWYLGELFLIGVVAILILYSPFFVADRIRQARSRP